MITKEMVIGGFWALTFLVLAYFFFEFFVLISRPANFLSGFLG